MSNRKQSIHIVKVFDPRREPTLPDILKAEQAKDPKVTAIRAEYNRLGLVSSPKGTFWLDEEGVGGKDTVEKNGCSICFYRSFAEGFDVIPFASAKYTLEECLACATGETLRLDEFIRNGSRMDDNFETWERLLE